MSGLKYFTITIAVLLGNVACHSWIECTDYNPVSFDYDKIGNFDRARCRGYPRAFQRQFEAGFAIDTGYNNEYDNCERYPYSENDYSDTIPMAKLQAGQVLYISHPTKGHVADTCTNPFIPSTSMKVKMSSKPGVDTFDVELAMVGDDHVNGNIDHLGYQRCYNFCENPDKSHCLTAWTLPSSIPDGQYSFIWQWQFNSQQFYSNCFDAIIGQGSGDVSASGSGTMAPTVVPNTSIPNSSSGSLSSSGSDAGSITFVPSVPTPAVTTSSSSTETPSTQTPSTQTPSTEEPVESVTPAPEIVSSSASIDNPIASLTRYIMGSFNITMTEFNNAARALRNLNQ